MANADEEHVIPNYSPWLSMDLGRWDCITRDATLLRFRKHQLVYPQQDAGDFVYLVKTGRVRLDVYSRDGECKSLYIAEPGSLFGELSIIDGHPAPCGATASADSLVYRIARGRFVEEMEQNCEFCRSLLLLLARKTRLLCAQVKQLSFNDSTYKVCYALCHLARRHGTPVGRGYRLDVKFTHPEMGELVGLSRVSVSGIMNELIAKGAVEKDGGFLLIRDMAELERYLEE